MKTKEEKSVQKAITAKKREKVVTSLLMIIVGVLLIIWPNAALNVLCSIVGLALCIGGVVAVITYFVTRDKSFVLTMTMAVGVIVAFLGLWIFLNPSVLAALIPAIIGAFIIISGIINLSEAITIHRERGTGIVTTLIIAAITIVLGLIVFFRPQWTNAFLVRLIGIALVFDGVSDLWVISRITGTVKEVAADLKAPDGKAVDENGERVSAKAYAPDDSAEAKAEEGGSRTEDGKVRPLKGFFRKDKTVDAEQERAADEATAYNREAENFTETHSYTTTTVKRPAHTAHEESDAGSSSPETQKPEEKTTDTDEA